MRYANGAMAQVPGGALRRRRVKICLAVICTVSAAAIPAPAFARAYYSESLDGLVARCSTVNTTTLPQESLERYGIEADQNTGLLSCVVQKQTPGTRPENIRARVEAEYHPTGQPPREIDIREVRENNLVTYLGTYPVRGEGPLLFSVDVKVEGAAVSLDFDDQSPRT